MDALSRLPMTTDNISDEFFLNCRVFEDSVVFPLDLQHLAQLQKDDSQLLRLSTDKRSRENSMKTTINDVAIWTVHSKVFVSKKGRSPLITWYHDSLHHDDLERTARTLRQHFD